MLAEPRDKWLTALRSGKYFQTSASLRNVTKDGIASFCCLGVLADVIGTEWESRDDDNRAENGLCNGITVRAAGRSYLSGKICELVDISARIQEELAAQNDAGVPFPAIADWIETNIPADAAFQDAE